MSGVDIPGFQVNGDSRPSVQEHYLSISSDDRKKSARSSPNDSTIDIADVSNVLSLELQNFEIPHTTYPVNEFINTLYISEKISDTEYNFFGLVVGTSGYLVQNLAVALELSQQCPRKYSTDAVLQNTYNFVTSGATGKVAIVSSGDVEFNIHNATEQLSVIQFTKNSDTDATIKFLASYENVIAPGAILTLKLYNNPEIEIQVISNDDIRTVTVMGDFSDLDETTIDLNNAYMIPYSAERSVSDIIGFGAIDFQPGSMFESMKVLGVASPFAGVLEDDGMATPMVCTEFPPFVSSEDYIKLSGTHAYMSEASMVRTTHDDTHFELEIDPNQAFLGSGMSTFTSSGTSFDVDSITVETSGDNASTIAVTFGENISGVSVGDELTVVGFTGEQWDDFTPTITVTVVTSATEISGTIDVPSLDMLKPGETYATPVNPTTGYNTTYISPNRFDLSRHRRIILCRVTVDDLDIGSLSIPNDRTKYFARIQLFSGADLVNFTGPLNAVGKHNFNSLQKRVNAIRFRFYNENGTPYEFEGVDFTLLLKITCLDSNTGI